MSNSSTRNPVSDSASVPPASSPTGPSMSAEDRRAEEARRERARREEVANNCNISESGSLFDALQKALSNIRQAHVDLARDSLEHDLTRPNVWLHARSWFMDEEVRLSMARGTHRPDAPVLILPQLVRVDDEIGNLVHVLGASPPSRSERWRVGYGLLMCFLDENPLGNILTPDELQSAEFYEPGFLEEMLQHNSGDVCEQGEYSTSVHNGGKHPG